MAKSKKTVRVCRNPATGVYKGHDAKGSKSCHEIKGCRHPAGARKKSRSRSGVVAGQFKACGSQRANARGKFERRS